jgi:hypothetical protein
MRRACRSCAGVEVPAGPQPRTSPHATDRQAGFLKCIPTRRGPRSSWPKLFVVAIGPVLAPRLARQDSRRVGSEIVASPAPFGQSLERPSTPASGRSNTRDQLRSAHDLTLVHDERSDESVTTRLQPRFVSCIASLDGPRSLRCHAHNSVTAPMLRHHRTRPRQPGWRLRTTRLYPSVQGS